MKRNGILIMNEKKVFDYIKSHRNCTITQIADSLKMNFPDVFVITNSLMEKGAIGYTPYSLGINVDDSAYFYAILDNFENN